MVSPKTARAKLDRARLESMEYAADLDALVILARARDQAGGWQGKGVGVLLQASTYLMDRNGIRTLTGCMEFQERWTKSEREGRVVRAATGR